MADDPRHPRFIETVRGRGYRFIGTIDIHNHPQLPVAESERMPANRTIATESPDRSSEKLKSETLSADTDTAYNAPNPAIERADRRFRDAVPVVVLLIVILVSVLVSGIGLLRPWQATDPPDGDSRSIAVLPFVNLSAVCCTSSFE